MERKERLILLLDMLRANLVNFARTFGEELEVDEVQSVEEWREMRQALIERRSG